MPVYRIYRLYEELTDASALALKYSAYEIYFDAIFYFINELHYFSKGVP